MNPVLALALTASVSLPPAASPPPGIAVRPSLATQAMGMADARPTSLDVAASAARAAFAPPGGDSLKNGAIIGGVIAGVAAGAFVYTLCRSLDGETVGPDNCASPALLSGALFGAGGAAVGAGVDALFMQRPTFRATVRVRF